VQELLSGVPDLASLGPDACIEADLASSLVFVIHSGGDSQRLPGQSVTGKAWSALPVLNPQTVRVAWGWV
jgi:hypothetical protein